MNIKASELVPLSAACIADDLSSCYSATPTLALFFPNSTEENEDLFNANMIMVWWRVLLSGISGRLWSFYIVRVVYYELGNRGLYECSFEEIGQMMALVFSFLIGTYSHCRLRATKRAETNMVPECKKADIVSEVITRNTAKMGYETSDLIHLPPPLCGIEKLPPIAEMYPPFSTVHDISPETTSAQDPPLQLSIVENNPSMKGGAEAHASYREWLPKMFVVEFNQGLDGVKFGPVGNNRNMTRIVSVPEGSKGYVAGLRNNDLVLGVNEGHDEDFCTILKKINRKKRQNKPFKLRVRKKEDALADEAWEGPTKAPLSPSSITTSPMSLDSSLISFPEYCEVKRQRSLSFNQPSETKEGCFVSPDVDLPCYYYENSQFGKKLMDGVLICKYDRGGNRHRRVLFYNHARKLVMWCKAVWGWAGKSGNRKYSLRPSRLLRSCSLANLVTICAGDEPDNKTPGKRGNQQLRSAAKNNDALMSKSMSLVFKERSLEIMLTSKEEMHEFVNGFQSIVNNMSCFAAIPKDE